VGAEDSNLSIFKTQPQVSASQQYGFHYRLVFLLVTNLNSCHIWFFNHGA
ncbi:uncharacterized protein METZ01_LOCUS161704, partial [marine metagenome]